MVAQPDELKPMQEILPVWSKVQTGLAKWEDFTFEERTEKGWLVPLLMDIDAVTHKRWDWWMQALFREKLPDEPIPRIEWGLDSRNETRKMLEKCLTHHMCPRLPDFFEWLLWAFGRGERRPSIDEKLNEHWYRTFNLDLMMQNPHDYLGDLMSETKGSGRWNNPHAFFPTPHTIVEMMVRMNFEGVDVQKLKDGRDPRTLSVMDPCVGSGRFLMHASNYSVNLYGMDIDYVCVMACTINAVMYVPWLAHSAPWLKQHEPLEVKDALQSLPPTEERIIKVAKPVKGKSQMLLFG